MELVFVTANANKAAEVQKVLSNNIKILSLKDLGCMDEIEESADSFTGNALLKAKFIFEKYKLNCFADDSGLEIEALNGKPGVYSARYAGEPKNDKKNVLKLLSDMEGKSNRTARFITVIALIIEGKNHFFEGEIKGLIDEKPRGCNGFGYDPIFIPEGFNKTFAEMSANEKNTISHRAIAISKMNDFLRNC